jgi:hypothetical protein
MLLGGGALESTSVAVRLPGAFGGAGGGVLSTHAVLEALLSTPLRCERTW